MLISVTAPSKGMGQSVSTINLAVMISRLIGEKALIIDINKYCKDIAFYLSNSVCTKGLDDFKCLMEANMLNSRTAFNSCVKNVHESIDIMDSNESYDLSDTEISNLIAYTNVYYPVTVVDTIWGKSIVSKTFFDKSDAIIIIVNQTINTISKIVNDDFYKKYIDKAIFIVNKYMSSYDNKRIRYTMKEIKKDLGRYEILKDRIFELSFDVDLINDCNENAILNYLLNNHQDDNKYLRQLEAISKYLLENFGNINADDLVASVNQVKKSILGSIFKLKQRGSLDAKYE